MNYSFILPLNEYLWFLQLIFELVQPSTSYYAFSSSSIFGHLHFVASICFLYLHSIKIIFVEVHIKKLPSTEILGSPTVVSIGSIENAFLYMVHQPFLNHKSHTCTCNSPCIIINHHLGYGLAYPYIMGFGGLPPQPLQQVIFGLSRTLLCHDKWFLVYLEPITDV